MSQAIIKSLQKEIQNENYHSPIEWRIVVSPLTIQNYMIDKYNNAVARYEQHMKDHPMLPIPYPDFNQYVKPITELKLLGYPVRFDKTIEKPFLEKITKS